MKKLILGFAIVATTTLGSSAFAWVCEAHDYYSGAWGQSGVWFYQWQAAQQALALCRNVSPYCQVTACY